MNAITNRRPTALFAGALLALLSGLGAAACHPDRDGPRGFDYAPYFSECPQDSVLIYVVTDTIAPKVDTVTDIPLATRQDNLPEFHDCQALMLNKEQYGPLVGMFAADWLDTLPGVLSQAHQAAGNPRLGVAVAELYNFDRTKDYGPLGIRREFNCLYLVGDGADWEAWMVPVRNKRDACLTPMEFSATDGTRLRVRAEPLPAGLQGSDVPPVARWDWDSVNSEAYIGIKCGDLWCEIGEPKFQPSSGYSLGMTGGELGNTIHQLKGSVKDILGSGSVNVNEMSRVLAIKGWYDEQVLAEPGPAGGLRPSGLKATIIPHPQLDGLRTFPESIWVQTAFIIVHGDPGIYKGKLDLAQGLNEIQVCKGTATECSVSPMPACASTSVGWWQRMGPPKALGAPRCIHRVGHEGGGVIPAGAARWRWVFNDEKSWVRCETGCCTVQ